MQYDIQYKINPTRHNKKVLLVTHNNRLTKYHNFSRKFTSFPFPRVQDHLLQKGNKTLPGTINKECIIKEAQSHPEKYKLPQNLKTTH